MQFKNHFMEDSIFVFVRGLFHLHFVLKFYPYFSMSQDFLPLKG